MHSAFFRVLLCAVLLSLSSASTRAAEATTYSQQEIIDLTSEYFGQTAEGMTAIVGKIFAELGEPHSYIAGEELSGAVGFGLRYGRGELVSRTLDGAEVYWTGPSVGFDLGGDTSKVFVLVYNLQRVEDLFQRFPGVDGSLYYVAGVGVNYQSVNDVTLAPIRVGIGLRAGASIGYVHYTRERSWMPF